MVLTADDRARVVRRHVGPATLPHRLPLPPILRGGGDDAGELPRIPGFHDDAALRFARRKRIGPFAPEAAERQEREKAIAAMVRAGHPYGISRTIAELAPGAEIEPGFLSEAPEEHPI